MSWAVVHPLSRHDLESTVLGGLMEMPKMLVHRRRLRRTGQVWLRSMSLAVTPKALLRSRFQLGDIEATFSTRKAISMWRSSLSFVIAEMMRTTAAKRQERLPRRPRRVPFFALLRSWQGKPAVIRTVLLILSAWWCRILRTTRSQSALTRSMTLRSMGEEGNLVLSLATRQGSCSQG